MLRFFVVLAGLLMLLPLLMKFVLHVIVPRTVPVGVLLLLPAGLMRFVPDGACSSCFLLCCCRAVALMLPVAVSCCSSYRSAFHERRLRMNPCPGGSSGQEPARGRRRQAARGAQGPRVNVRPRQHPVAADDPVRGLRLLGHLLGLQGIKESLFLRCGKAGHRPGREVPGVRPPPRRGRRSAATWASGRPHGMRPPRQPQRPAPRGAPRYAERRAATPSLHEHVRGGEAVFGLSGPDGSGPQQLRPGPYHCARPSPTGMTGCQPPTSFSARCSSQSMRYHSSTYPSATMHSFIIPQLLLLSRCPCTIHALMDNCFIWRWTSTAAQPFLHSRFVD